MYIHSPFVLPDVEFVGGATQELKFRCYHKFNNEPTDMSACTANFSVINAVNKYGSPLISKPMTIMQGEENGEWVYNVLYVVLEPGETNELRGKYIYQVTVKDMSGISEIPGQGLLHITNNINKSYLA